MIRRQFIRLISFAGASSLPRLGMAATGGKQTITYHIKGFSCVTCAVGLDVMLERKDGVAWCKSSYTDATSTICFNPAVIGEPSLKQAIAEMGFTAELTH
jgi:copper chaperone CopZ